MRKWRLLDGISYLIGDWENFTLEHRVYNAGALWTIIISTIVAINNVIMGLYGLAVGIMLFNVAASYILWVSRFKGKIYYVGMFITGHVLLIWAYINSNGIKGNTLYFFTMTYTVLLLSLRKKYHLLTASVVLVIVAAVFSVE